MANNPQRIFTIKRSFRVSTSLRMLRQHSTPTVGLRALKSRLWRSRRMQKEFPWAASKPKFFQTIN